MTYIFANKDSAALENESLRDRSAVMLQYKNVVIINILI